MDKELTARQSAVIDAMRFLLIVLVLFVHMLPPDFQSVSLDFTGKNVYIFFTEMISHNLGAMAVPAFFVFSGYFFFYSKESTSYDFKWFCTKWKKRVTTILIPYIAWNALNIIVIVIKNISLSLIGASFDENFISLQSINLFKWFWLDPIDFPLWYLRDLLCMIAISPLFYLAFKYIGKWFILILFAFFITKINIPVIGFSSTAICFFGTGACLALSGSNFLNLAQKVKYPSIVLAPILLIASTLTSGLTFNHLIKSFFIPTGILALINVTDSLNDRLIGKLAPLSVMVFFIYSAHTIYLIEWGNGLFMRLFQGSLLGWTIRYFTEPFLVLLICIVLYRLLKRLMPKPLAFICGGRTE